MRKVWGTGVWIPVVGGIDRVGEAVSYAPIVGIFFREDNLFVLMSYPASADGPTSSLQRPAITSALSGVNLWVSTPYQVVPLITNWALDS